MLNIEKTLEKISDIIDINDISYGVTIDGNHCIRVTACNILTTKEKNRLKRFKGVTGLDNICHYRYAPEIQYSYFYIVGGAINE